VSTSLFALLHQIATVLGDVVAVMRDIESWVRGRGTP